jgi:hypothetical protein
MQSEDDVEIFKVHIFFQIFSISNFTSPQSKRGSMAARLLGLWVQIPPGHGCLSLASVVCCQVEISASG